jgi:lambda family phage tail tape measure protein
MSGARLDAEGARLKAWHEEYRDTVKRALDESRTDYEGYWALVMAGERHLAEAQLRMARQRSGEAAARGDTPEVIKLKGEIDALQARLKTGITAETERGLAGDREKAKAVGDNSRIDWINADTKALTEAAAWRRQNLSLLDQELIAAREKGAADLRERQAQLTKNDTLKHAPELLKQYQQAAADQSASTLAGIEAEIRARREANTFWITGAKAASRDYIESVDDAASQHKRAWSGTWKRAEDDLTTFYTSGKLNVRGFVEYSINELARIQLAQPVVRKIAGFADGLFDKMAGLGPSTNYAEGYGPMAKGAVVDRSADLHQYVNTVVSSPTLFRFAKGGAFGGLFGEAGPEAVMPLKRGKDGSLGVQVQGGGGGLNLTYAPVFQIDARGAGVGVGQMLQGVVDAAVNRSKSELMADLAAGGQFAYATGRRRG